MKYCPKCAHQLVEKLVDGRERLVCEKCGFIFYLNPKVATGTLIEEEGKVVLVRRGVAPRAGYWGLPAGYMELDETVEEAAIREAKEETGLEVELDELLGVYSFGGETQVGGVLILYAAHVVGGQVAPGDDATEVRLFSPDELPPDSEIAFATHRQALRHWRQAKIAVC